MRQQCVSVDTWPQRVLKLGSASLYSLGHGGNDARKTMGVIAGEIVFAWALTLPAAACT